MQLLMLGPSKQPKGVRYTGCISQSSPQGWSQSPSSPLPAWCSYQKIPDASSAILMLVCPKRNIRCMYTYSSTRLLAVQHGHGPPAIPSAFVLTACSRGDDQDLSLQDPACCKVRQVCRHLAPTGYRTVTRGNLDASCEIPEVTLNSGATLWMWLPHSPKSVTRQSLLSKSTEVPNFCQVDFKKKKPPGHSSLWLFWNPCFHSYLLATFTPLCLLLQTFMSLSFAIINARKVITIMYTLMAHLTTNQKRCHPN